jgi:hypothetical protein
MSIGHTEERVMRLVNRLIHATDRGQIEWAVANETNTAFHTSLRSGGLTIRSLDDDGTFPFVVDLFTPDGRLLQSIRTGQPAAEGSATRPYEWNALWRELYDAARGRALNIDALIDAMIDDVPDD